MRRMTVVLTMVLLIGMGVAFWINADTYNQETEKFLGEWKGEGTTLLKITKGKAADNFVVRICGVVPVVKFRMWNLTFVVFKDEVVDAKTSP